jgi:very-short-patch-repair endonuclease
MFIADFYCHKVRLVIEIDGEIHERQKEYDIGRSAEMGKYYIKVIRFSNEEVEFEIDKVIRIIEQIVNDRISSPLRGGFRGN